MKLRSRIPWYPNLSQSWNRFIQFFCLWILLFQLLCSLCLAEMIKLPLRRTDRSLHGDHMKHLLELRHRRSLFTQQHRNIFGKPGEGYYIQVNIGTPPQALNVLIDTGSSNFAVAAAPDPMLDKYFHTDSSSTYKDSGQTVNVPYTQGEWDGVLGTDMVSLFSVSNVTVEADIAFITRADNFYINGSNWQGILGLAYAHIAMPDESVVPLFDTMVTDGKLENIFSIQLCGSLYNSDNHDMYLGGSMIFGGIDETLYSGEILYATLFKEWYYEIILLDVQVDGHSLNMDCKEYNFGKTIVDSGTTNLRLPMKVFDDVLDRIKRFVDKTDIGPGISNAFWTGVDVLCWKEGLIPYEDFPVVSLSVATSQNSSFQMDISPQQYLRAVGEANDLEIDEDCFKFAITSSDTGAVIGAVVMEGFYVIFDRQNKRVGFAQTSCPQRDPSKKTSAVSGPNNYKGDIFDCAYTTAENDKAGLTIAAYVMAAICVACILPLTVLMIKWKCRNKKSSDNATHDLIEDK